MVMCPICGPFAVWLGIKSLREEESNPMAIIGIVLGAVALLVPFLLVVILVIYKFTIGTPPSLPPLPGGPGLLLKLLPWS